MASRKIGGAVRRNRAKRLLREAIADRIQRLAGILARGLAQAGLDADNPTYFDTLTFTVG